jgi:hypothetical protein
MKLNESFALSNKSVSFNEAEQDILEMMLAFTMITVSALKVSDLENIKSIASKIGSQDAKEIIETANKLIAQKSKN